MSLSTFILISDIPNNFSAESFLLSYISFEIEEISTPILTRLLATFKLFGVVLLNLKLPVSVMSPVKRHLATFIDILNFNLVKIS
jgi:hypothetical protein